MIECQGIFVLREVGSNLSEDHSVKFLKCLIEIFKELYPYFFYDKYYGRKREHKLDELLGLNSWGDYLGLMSCRRKASMCLDNNESVQVLISTEPSKTTINDFNNDYSDLIEDFDNFIVEFCTIMGLVGGDTFVADGTFLEAYANNFVALYPDEISYVEDFLKSIPEYELAYDTLLSFYRDDKDLDDKSMIYLLSLLNEMKYNISIHGIRLITYALSGDDQYDEVMAKLEHMKANITKDNVRV